MKALFSRVMSVSVVVCRGIIRLTRLFEDAERDVSEGIWEQREAIW